VETGPDPTIPNDAGPIPEYFYEENVPKEQPAPVFPPVDNFVKPPD